MCQQPSELALNSHSGVIDDNADMSTGSQHDEIITTKTISAVREIDAFNSVSRSPSKTLQALNSAI